jgi:hypothetical protein
MSVPPIQTGNSVSGADINEKPKTTDTKNAQDAYSSEQSGPEDEVYDTKNPFLDPDVEAHWRQVYEDSTYECRHVFDPALTWTEEEEKAIVRKLDWRVCLWAVSENGIQLD